MKGVIVPAMVRVRRARATDSDFVIATAARLSAFGPPAWREAEDVVEGEVRTLRDFFDCASPSADVLIAESAEGEPLGFAYLDEARDYFTLEWHGHLGILAVSAEAEGKGAGAALMRAAEAWARSRGYPTLTLNVFADNRHARDVYEHFGFQQDTVKYLKVL